MTKEFSTCLGVSATILVIGLLHGGLARSELRLSVPPKQLKLKVGLNETLSCRSNLGTEVDCQWQRNGHPVVVGRGMWKSKYDWQGSSKHGDCSLRLIGSNLEYHSGTWECTVSDLQTLGNTVTSNPVKVILLVEPSDMKIEVVGSGMWIGQLKIEHGKVTVQEGTNITANCSMCCGSPNATITWKKVTASRTLSLSSVKRNTRQDNFTWLSEAVAELYVTRDDNRATLMCSVYHDTFRGAGWKSRQITLNVLYPPRNILVPRNLTGYLHEQVILDCPLSGNPTPTYKWYFQGENGTWAQLQDDDGKGITLTLDNANINQSGFYNCTAVSEVFSRKYEASGLLYLTLVEGGAFRALKTTEAMILGIVLGVILLIGLIGFILWLRKRKTGRTYVSANDKESTPEGPIDTGGGGGADGETQLNQMAWNTEASPKEKLHETGCYETDT